MSRWCEEATRLPAVFYGNFVAYQTKFMQSPAVIELSRYLFYEEGKGYFKTRWTDQAVPPAFLCHALSGVHAAHGEWLDARILYLPNLRHTVFVHKKLVDRERSRVLPNTSIS